ncbi:hypothetical protein [Flavobacterium fluviatile]|uniref:hypothetical protein n=1 Tax=Flavobacterium fluviatile TaxID=1862387 RepID=UPI0013D7D3E5|nr:hypothetical protein [Flavobacterium fluviatile]
MKTKEIKPASTIDDQELINVILSLRGKETIRGAKLQIEFKKGYCWTFRVLDCLEKNNIISKPDKYGDSRLLVDNDFFDSEFIVLDINSENHAAEY